jgi:hypothetical protein
MRREVVKKENVVIGSSNRRIERRAMVGLITLARQIVPILKRKVLVLFKI